jgi:hypothetical protein
MRPAQIFLYSDRDPEGEGMARRPSGSTEGDLTKTHKALSIDQVMALEEFVVKHNLPMVKSKIRWAAQKLRIPYQRSVEYLFRKYKKEEPDILEFYERCMDELRTERERMDKAWKKYLYGCRRYGRPKSRKD